MTETPTVVLNIIFYALAFVAMFVYILRCDVKELKEDVRRLQKEMWQAELKSIRDKGK